MATIEEFSIFFRWVEDEVPGDHFLEIIPFKAADARTIYSYLVEFMKDKNTDQQARRYGLR